MIHQLIDLFNLAAGSTSFKYFHALQNAHGVIITSDDSEPLLQAVVCTFITAFGGGMLTSVLLGEPIKLFFNPNLIPIYVFTVLAIKFTPLLQTVNQNLAVFTPFFRVVDAVSRATSLPGFIMHFREMQLNSNIGRDSFAGQLMKRYLATCGGGILYKWGFARQTRPFFVDFWNSSVILVNVLLVIFVFELQEADGGWLFTIAQGLQKLGFNIAWIQIDELKFICSVLVSWGFLVPVVIKAFTVKSFGTNKKTDDVKVKPEKKEKPKATPKSTPKSTTKNGASSPTLGSPPGTPSTRLRRSTRAKQ